MTAGALMPREIYPTSSGLNTGALDSRIPVAQPFAGFVDPGSPGNGAFTIAHLATLAKSLTASGPGVSFEITDWYFRIHILPNNLALGNVVSNEVFTIGVWNAWLATAQTLNTIVAVDAGGTTLTGQPPTPLIFQPNQQLDYTLSIDPLGPPTIDASYTFTFADGEVVELTMFGQRITAWALTPDWQTPVEERLGWKTDRLRAWDATEQRRALRIAPRRNVKFSTWMSDQDKQYIENQFFAWGALIWALPIWWDGQRLSVQSNPGDVVVLADTVGRDFVANGLAIILNDARTFEVIQLGTITSTQLSLVRAVVGTWPTGSKLYPVRNARLMNTQRITRNNGSNADVEPEFLIVEACDWPAATGLPTYRGAPVLEDSPSVTDTSEGSYDRDTFTIDNQTGAIDVYDSAQIGFPNNSHNWFLQGKTAHSNFRSLLYLLKGAQGEIWVPSYENDLQLVVDIASADVSIQCANSGIALYAAKLNRQDIRVELVSGTVFYRRITGAVLTSPTVELVNLNAGFGVAIKRSTVRRISFMVLSCLASDEITIQHDTAIRGISECSTPFRAVNHDI
jgi:hypothetical protein